MPVRNCEAWIKVLSPVVMVWIGNRAPRDGRPVS